MSGLPGHNSQLHARLPYGFLGMDACVTSRLNLALFHKLCVALMCFAYLFELLSTSVFYNQALADARSTGAVIECLHCTCRITLTCLLWMLNGLYSFSNSCVNGATC